MFTKPRKNTINPFTKIPDKLRGLLNRSVRSIDNNSVTAAVSIDVDVVETRITNRRDRVIILSQCFRE